MITRPHILRRAFHDKLLMILKANRISFYDYDAFMYVYGKNDENFISIWC